MLFILLYFSIGTSFSDFSYGYIAGDPKTVNQLASHTWLSPFNWISVDLAAKPLNILTDVVDSCKKKKTHTQTKGEEEAVCAKVF